MSNFVFVNNTNPTSKADNTLNVLISYRSYQEYLDMKDRSIQEICKMMNLRRKQEIEERLEQIAITRVLDDDGFNHKVEKAIGKIIEQELAAGGIKP